MASDGMDALDDDQWLYGDGSKSHTAFNSQSTVAIFSRRRRRKLKQGHFRSGGKVGVANTLFYARAHFLGWTPFWIK